MAVLNLVVLEGGIRKQKASNTQTVDFASIRIGASNLQILETSGAFDFSNKKLTNVANPTALQDVATKDYVDNSTGNAANKTLSNLNSPTAVNQDMLPDTDNSRNLGSMSSRWASVNSDFISATSSIGLRDTSGNPILTSAVTGPLQGLYTGPFLSGPSSSGVYDSVGIRTRPNANNDAVPSENVVFVTGNKDNGTGDSGSVIVSTGTSVGGARGELRVSARQLNMTSSGKIVNLLDPSSLQDAATKNYVDGGLANKLNLAGGTMSGAIAMGTNKITGLGDPTALQDAATKNYVDNQDALKVTKAGDTMTGTLAMGANKVTSSYVPDANNVLVNKLYVDGLIAGALWLNPIIDPNLIDDSLSTPPGSPVIGDTYIAGATATGAWATFDGHAFMWNGSAWVNLLGRAVIAGDRFGVSMESAQAGAGGLLAKDDQIATVLSPTPGSVTYTFQVPIVSNAVYVNNVNSYHTGHQYDYTASGWVEFGGLNAVAAGIGLMYSGNALNINMGAGIVQLPSDEVGVDVHANGGLMTTVDNSASSTLTGAQLALKLADTSLAKSSSGVKANLDEDTLTLNSTLQVQHARSLTNDNAGSITAGQVVYIKSNGAVDLARADVAGLDSIWIGVVKAPSIATTAAGLVVVRPGAIISGLSGLTPGVKQYISRATAGALTSSLTGFVTGEHVYSVGYAISATEMVYQPQFEYVF
jgi:hypothetical protein